MDVRGLVEAELERRKAPRATRQLWGEVIESFEQRGPEAVTTLVQAKVREVKRRVKKEEDEIRAVAKKAPKEKSRRRPKR
jgi:hydrogenase maturation factor HypE